MAPASLCHRANREFRGDLLEAEAMTFAEKLARVRSLSERLCEIFDSSSAYKPRKFNIDETAIGFRNLNWKESGNKFSIASGHRSKISSKLYYACALIIYLNIILVTSESIARSSILSDENFTFVHNGSFIQIDAGREWPFNSKREIVFRFKTKSPHGLLIYQTFDHNKLVREDDQENQDLGPIIAKPSGEIDSSGSQSKSPQQPSLHQQSNEISDETLHHHVQSSHVKRKTRVAPVDSQFSSIKQLNRGNRGNLLSSNEPLTQLASNAITATASEKLVNSLFSSSPAATINGNHLRSALSSQTNSRDGPPSAVTNLASSIDAISSTRNHRVLSSLSIGTDASTNRVGFSSRGSDSDDRSTILSSSAINSFSASLYELYLKLENGRLKLMYEFGSRLNQTYCGKGLNDDRWHKVDLRVDPELNQMILILDQTITVEIVLSQMQQEDESVRRSELVFTNSILYLGGLNNNASIVKNVKQRLYMAQFIGCIGQILIKTDQHTESTLQPVAIDKMALMNRGCLNKCETNNYCLHKSTCVNYYSHTKCDCFGTNYEDVYCWQDQLTTLTMLGYSTLVHRIYDWRDRHHSSVNRLSLQFKTTASDSVLFFAYGDSNAASMRSPANSLTSIQTTASFPLASQTNLSNPITVPRPTTHQFSANSNYLAVSLFNGSIVVEVNFGDQPIILSNLFNEKYFRANSSKQTDLSPLSLADKNWHNITFIHSYKHIHLYIDNRSVNHTSTGKNYHLYFDPSVYVGGVPNLLLNETKTLSRPFNLRHKFVGCLKSVYFNQHNILLALKQKSPMVEYRDTVGKPRLDSCIIQEPNSLPLTMRSGKSYLTFQLSANTPTLASNAYKFDRLQSQTTDLSKQQQHMSNSTLKKLTKIEFEYKTALRTHFLAGGHLRDLSYHDLGGFWTLHAREDCQLYFTISSGLTYEPEQIIELDSPRLSCEPNLWYKVAILIITGDKLLNVTRYPVDAFDDSINTNEIENVVQKSYVLRSSVELLHHVQLGGDLAKFGDTSSVPFTGCMRRIKINNHLFDSRDFVSNNMISSLTTNANTQNSTASLQGITQSDLVSSRMAQGYVTLDSCGLVNPCTNPSPCKNNGTCRVNELGEADCDCSRTGYTGKRCHFSIYKQSCHDLFLSGQRKSSYYLIDLDRNGPLKPIRVRCNMDNNGGLIETSLSHNLPAEFLIRRSTKTDISLDITYLAFHHMYTADGFYNHDENDDSMRSNQNLVLRGLIGQSLFCKQHIRYECRSSLLELGNKTWMESQYPKTHRIFSLDRSNAPGYCDCATSEKKCLDPLKRCNCDSGETIWSDDSHEFMGHENVGLTKIVILKPDYTGESFSGLLNSESQSRITLSDLRCYGVREHESQHEITFKTSDAYIEVPGWRRGDISFSFRTASNPPAIILYQLATSRNHGYFRLTLISDTRLLFEFIINRRPRKLFLTSTHKLNNGEWQQVFIEYDPFNLRLSVNDDSVIVDLDPNDFLGTFEGPLFIGGAPSKYLVGDLSKRNGFTGCFRGLRIDNRSIDLRSYLSPSMPTVIGGCQPSCTKNLCQNDGKCIEYWGSYECECSNPIAHSGNNCEINLNTNSITFVTQEAFYIQASNDSSIYPPYLVKNLLMNIRTYQETALIFYACDHFNNFIQLHKNGSSLVLSFNSNNTVVVAQVPIDDILESDITISSPSSTNQLSIAETNLATQGAQRLIAINQTQPTNQVTSASLRQQSAVGAPAPTNTTSGIPIIDRSIRVSNTSGSGQPIQIKIERHRLRTTFYVNNNFLVIEKPMILLNNYTQNPWINSDLELVRPMRLKTGNKMYSRMFLANIDEYFNTRLPGFTGCVQGLNIDNQLFDFNRAHLVGEFKGDYRIGCKMHCDSFPCKNQGTCVENWLEDRTQCKCESTSYVGGLCDEDIAAIFNGQTSYFLYHLSKKISTKQSPIKSSINLSVNDSESQLIATDQSPKPIDPAFSDRIPKKNSIDTGDLMNYFEINLAFSTDTEQGANIKDDSRTRVIALITRVNSSRYFLLGLTADGSLLVQEDYGNSMSLSRLIKRPEQPYNDGHRHMVRYTRFNQTIQIIVDFQTYLPTMSVIPSSQASKFSKQSVVLVGTASHRLFDEIDVGSEYSNFHGCISNLVIKMDEVVVEPLSEAFGQNLETIATVKTDNNLRNNSLPVRDARSLLQADKQPVKVTHGDNADESNNPEKRTLNVIDKSNGMEALENMETIVARFVEQGKCASFKKIELSNEKRSINEPKNTLMLEPRSVYMDPPRVKVYKSNYTNPSTDPKGKGFTATFYCCLTFLIVISSSLSLYSYVLHVNYKSEKFRCETPFFHKRDSSE